MNAGENAETQKLREVLQDHEKVLQQALVIVRREQPIVQSLQAAIVAIRGEVIPTGSGAAATNGAPTTVQSLAPTRKHEYTDMTAIGAIQKALNKITTPGTAVHIDRVAEEIYNPIPDRDVFYRIKRTLVSEAIRGMKKDLFFRGKKPNTFGIPRN
jgi:hypothetical protein